METAHHSSGQRAPPYGSAKPHPRPNQKPESYPPNDLQTFVRILNSFKKKHHIFHCRPERKRTMPVSNVMMEIGALLIVFVVCMVLVIAIKTDVPGLQTTMLVCRNLAE